MYTFGLGFEARTQRLTADAALDAADGSAGATEVGVLARGHAGSPGLEGLGTELGAYGRDGGPEGVGFNWDGVGGALHRVGNRDIIVVDLGHGGGREGESEDLEELHSAGSFGEVA